MKTSAIFVMVIVSLLFFQGCAMTTDPARIQGSYVSDTTYDNLDCVELEKELSSVLYEESLLVRAQKSRKQASDIQAFLWGVGTGDGVEAFKLADIRGKRKAIMEEMEGIPGCTIPGDAIAQVVMFETVPKPSENFSRKDN